MKTYRLFGLAEGVAGVPYVTAPSLQGVFNKLPTLNAIRSKLKIDANSIGCHHPCDG